MEDVGSQRVTYGKYDESDTRTFSIELEQCEENDVPAMLEAFDLGNEVTFSELADMGWRGKVMYSVPVKSIFPVNNSNSYCPMIVISLL